MNIKDIKINDFVDVTPMDGDLFHEFCGNVVNFRPDNDLVVVSDGDGNVWDCFPSQLKLIDYDAAKSFQ